MTEDGLLEDLVSAIAEAKEEAEANRPQTIVDTVKAVISCHPDASDVDLLGAIAECGLDNLTSEEVLRVFPLDSTQRALLDMLIEQARHPQH